MGLKAVFFEFDGVILESTDIKTAAFGELFRSSPHRRRIVAYHLRNAGLSRYRKFEHIYREFLGRPLAAAERRRLGAAFSKLVYRKVLACPMVPGAHALLRSNKGRLQFFVVSGTPQSELRRIVKARGLAPFFKGVYGSPRSKAEIVKAVLAARKIRPSEAVFVGDAEADRVAAEKTRVAFVARARRGVRGVFAKKVERVADMRGFSKWVAGRRAI